jgi:hypothetical protein
MDMTGRPRYRLAFPRERSDGLAQDEGYLQLEHLPPGVIGFEAVGEVDAGDYEQVLRPAVDAAASDGLDGARRLQAIPARRASTSHRLGRQAHRHRTTTAAPRTGGAVVRQAGRWSTISSATRSS